MTRCFWQMVSQFSSKGTLMGAEHNPIRILRLRRNLKICGQERVKLTLERYPHPGAFQFGILSRTSPPPACSQVSAMKLLAKPFKSLDDAPDSIYLNRLPRQMRSAKPACYSPFSIRR